MFPVSASIRFEMRDDFAHSGGMEAVVESEKPAYSHEWAVAAGVLGGVLVEMRSVYEDEICAGRKVPLDQSRGVVHNRVPDDLNIGNPSQVVYPVVRCGII